jgi:hypothetical protein
MNTIPSCKAALSLLRAEVRRAIGGEILKYQLTPRASFDGDGFDVAYDAEVVWEKQHEHTGEPTFGTHAGTIQLRSGKWSAPGWDASIFGGNYGLTEDQALDDRATGRHAAWHSDPREDSIIQTVDVLCQCGWGRLSIPESDVPAHCPVCGYQFITNDDDQEV